MLGDILMVSEELKGEITRTNNHDPGSRNNKKHDHGPLIESQMWIGGMKRAYVRWCKYLSLSSSINL